MIREGDHKQDAEFDVFIHCVYKKASYLLNDGRVSAEKASSVFLDKDTMLKVITECNKWVRETDV